MIEFIDQINFAQNQFPKLFRTIKLPSRKGQREITTTKREPMIVHTLLDHFMLKVSATTVTTSLEDRIWLQCVHTQNANLTVENGALHATRDGRS